MGFIARIFSPSPPPQPAPQPAPAPVALPSQAADPAGDAVQAAALKKQRRGGAGSRRGSETVLTGQDTLGATTGKTLLGA